MKINDDRMYHGAALTQIAEHPTFKAINAFWRNGKKFSCAFRINDTTGIYIKYAGIPLPVADDADFLALDTDENDEDPNTVLTERSKFFEVLLGEGKKRILSPHPGPETLCRRLMSSCDRTTQ